MQTEAIILPQNIQVPEYLTRAGARVTLTMLEHGESTLRDSAIQIANILASPEMKKLIESEKITLGMIKPELGENMDFSNFPVNSLADSDLTTELINQIKPPLKPLIALSLQMTPEMIDQFYAGNPKINQEHIPPERHIRYNRIHENRWQEFMSLMLRGPVTFIILQSSEGSAITEWRRQIGHSWNTKVVKRENPESLRARYSSSNHNNIFHGSDSPESVAKEINFVINYLQNL